ncbi:VOC family protein [Aquimarina sp. RZ0]|uniref:VOC family protein n=1 Tax=Aquimarina sp. RZ0 TaxID=2607730 RepID=UPI0011F1ADED|nr:VOC family protein [Aquimarina sp. RZ0]KAA1243263.1 glyoxalase [Aquimarina sp. RZ0]
MRLNAGILTKKIKETKSFYTENLGFKIKFENDFYLLLFTPNEKDTISFLLPNHPTQQPFFHPEFKGQGMYLTIEVDNVDEHYIDLKQKGIPIKVEIRDEPWGERHFSIEDPNGIGIDFVTYVKPLIS